MIDWQPIETAPLDGESVLLIKRKPRLLDLFCCAGGAGVATAVPGLKSSALILILNRTIRSRSFKGSYYLD